MSFRTCPPNMFHRDELGMPFNCISVDELTLFRKYDVLKCVYWIQFKKYYRVCLQFPDHMLDEAVLICGMIEERVHQKLYILADTTFGSCCVDYIAAKHVNADAIIHFGHACLSSTGQNQIPTLYVFPKQPLDVKAVASSIINLVNSSTSIYVLLYDVSYSHYEEELEIELIPVRHRVRLSKLAVPGCNRDSLLQSSNDHSLYRFARYFSLPRNEDSNLINFIYVTPEDKRKNFENFVVSSRTLTFYRYCNENPGYLEKQTLKNTLKKRYYEIQRIKEAKRIGIVVSTIFTDKYLDAVERIKTLCRLANKRSYIFSVGKVNVEKLANFPEISVFVLIGCPESEIINKKDFYQPVVGMMELEMALNENDVYVDNVITDFRDFLPGGSHYKEINEDELKKKYSETDVSLLDNTVIPNLETDKMIIEEETIAIRDPLTVATCNINEGLEGRSWKGLEPNIGQTPVEKFSVGRTGTPADGYEHSSASGKT